MADIQMLAITPTVPSGDFAPSKVTEAADGESFGQAFNQAKSTISEKNQAPERHEKKSLKKVDRSPKKPLAPSEKSQKALQADMPKLPAHVESPISKVQELGINAEAVGRTKKIDEEIFPIPQVSDDQADTASSELLAWSTVIQQAVNTDFADLPVGAQQTPGIDSNDLAADSQQAVNSDPVELPINDQQVIAKPDLIEALASGQRDVNSDNEIDLKISIEDRALMADRAAARADALARAGVPPQESSEKLNSDFAADGGSQAKATSDPSLTNGGQQAAASEKLTEVSDIWHVLNGNTGESENRTERPNSGQQNTRNADETLQNPGLRRTENTAPQVTTIPNEPKVAEAVAVRQVDDKTKLIDMLPNEKPISATASNQRPQQQSSENMSLDEIKEALPPGITNIEVSEEIESDAEFQPRIQKDTAPIIVPRAEPLVIEYALPKPNSGEVQAAAHEIAAEKIAADESATKAEAITQTDSATKADKIPIGQAETKANLTAEKTATSDQPIASAVQAEAAPAKATRAPQTAPPVSVIETNIPKLSAEETQAKAVQNESDEAAAKLSETPVIETETKNAAAKSERAAASNRPEQTAQVGKETQSNSQTAATNQTGPAAQAGSERQSGSQSEMNQNQPQNTSEADAIKDFRNVKNGEHSEFKAKFDSVMNSGTQSQQVSEAKVASSNINPTAHTENLFTTASTDLSLTTPQTNQVSVATPKQFLPAQAPMAQLEGSVRWLLRTDKKGAEIQLHPENLGRVTVQLRVEGAEVHARVWATEASTMPLLENHKAFLESSLKEQGLTLSSFDLQHGKNGQHAQGDPQNHHQHFAPPMMESWNGTEFRQELPTQLTTQHTDDGRVELYA